jgi:two-component system CheB/CheR fusion protein
MTLGEHDRAAKSESIKEAPPLIAGVGASAGGLEAFTQLLRHLPSDTGMAFVLVQHLDPHHESALTSLLSRSTAMPVEEVKNDLRVESNRVYVIPPNANMGIRNGVLKLEPLQKTRGVNHSIDLFFRSLAQDLRERAIGVILSGAANDGTLGMEAIKAEGGITFAQDDSAAYDSMPRSAIAAGCVDFILKPEDIAKELAQIAGHPLVVRQPISTAKDRMAHAPVQANAPAPPSAGDEALPAGTKQADAESDAAHGKANDADFKKILLLLRNHSGADFSLYKSTTIQRRIMRRMLLNGSGTLEEYAEFLRGNTKELDALYSDVLVSVTSFFRDPEAFNVVKREVFSKFVPKSREEPFRVWVLGCSTGQEAYSIAMAFLEARAERPIEESDEATAKCKLQIFATDLNDALLDKARQGLYAKPLMHDLSPERLRRFFVEEEGGYRVNKSLREMVVFAKQNLITDPPFSRMNLVSCRNLLIYLDPGLQQKLIPMFHYALKPDGFLFLGASESIGGFSELFEPLDKKHKIYSRKGSRTPILKLPPKKEREGLEPSPHLDRTRVETPLLVDGHEARNHNLHSEVSSLREADRVTVSKYSPPGVLVNAALQIVQFRGPTGAYLEPPTGKASFDVLKMARSGLMMPLRAAIAKAKKDNDTVCRENIRFERDGETQAVNVEVIPLKNLRERHFLILFDESEKLKVGRRRRKSAGAEGVVQRVSQEENSGRIADLERELAETRDYLQFIQEQSETGHEELQASNEEVQSANEELQSINEELETSKEELESANEELITINEEMAGRNAELSRLNSDLMNFQVASHLAVIVVGRDLTIRRFSALAEKPFNLFAADVGRPLGSLRHNLDLPDLSARVERVVASMHESEREVRDNTGHWHSLRIRPYVSLDNKVDGAVLVLVDIDSLKRTQQDITEARELAEAVIESVPDPLVVINGNLSIRSANAAFFRAFKLSAAEVEGSSIFEIDNGAWENPTLRRLIANVVPDENVFIDFEFTHDFKRVGRRSMLINGRVLRQSDGKPKLVLLGMRDITDQHASDRRRDEFLAILAHELRNPLAPIRNALHLLGKSEVDREQTTKLVEMMERQTDQLVRLVDELLTASRVTGNKIELKRERIDLASVLQDAMELSRPAMEIGRHDLRVTMPKEPVMLDADPMRLRQVFSNLLNNAAKYTDPGGTIWIEAARRGIQAVISIRDTGIGISPEMQPHIFELFMQVDRTKTRAQGGLGIGLALARSLVRLHGGEIEVQSKGLGEGATFIVRLPVASSGEFDASERPTEEGALQSMIFRRRALVVDDEHDVADSLVMLLESLGATVRVAYSGETALTAFDEFGPDIVFLDVGMSPMDGLETARRIRDRTGGRRLTLIALTGWGQEEDHRRTREAGFDHHLLKPLSLEALRKILAK